MNHEMRTIILKQKNDQYQSKRMKDRLVCGRNYFFLKGMIMDPSSQISRFTNNNTADLTALAHEIFHDEFQKETIGWHFAKNLAQSSRDRPVQAQFSMDVSSVITAHQAVMNEIERIEAELIENVIRWVSQNERTKEDQKNRNMLRIKNKSLFVDLEDPSMTKKYHLLCSRDYLPEKHECIVDFQFNEELQSWIKSKLPQKNSRIQPSYTRHISNTSTAPKTQAVMAKKSTHSMRRSRSHSLQKKSIIKIDFFKTVLIAEPQTVVFHNFNTGVQYQKFVLLKNAGPNIARFQIKKLDNPNITTIIKTASGDKLNIAPGMHVKIGINFCTDNSEDIEEYIMISVQYAKTVNIKVVAYRDPPKLTGFVTRVNPKYDHPAHFSTKCQNDFHRGIYQNALSIESVENDDVSENITIAGSTIECRKGFVGEFILVMTTIKNVGYSAEFFIMSEMDWYLMQVDDVTTSNIILLPSFAIWPAYFSLLHNEVLELCTFFYPRTYGLQVDKLYIVCDNYSHQSIELIGDGILFDSKFIRFGKNLERKVAEESSHFILDFGICLENTIVENKILVSNNSPMELCFRWEIESDSDSFRRNSKTPWYDLPFELFSIEPMNGSLPPASCNIFKVLVNTSNLSSGQYRIPLQLFVEDIPAAALPKNQEFYVQPSKTKRRTCHKSVDIWIGNIEVRLQSIILNLKIPFEETRKASTGSETKKPDLPEPIVEDQTSPETLCCQSDNVCLEPDVIDVQNFTPAIIRPGRSLYLNFEETFSIVVHNLSCKSAPFHWGKPSGPDDSKMKFFFIPKYGEIQPRSTRLLEIRCLPLKPGEVKYLFLPCYVGVSKIQKTLRIECTIESTSVTFYFPEMKDFHGSPKNETLRIHWEALSVFDPHKEISTEQEIRTVHLDPGNLLNEASVSATVLEDTITDPDQNTEEELEQNRESKRRSWDDLLQGIIWTKDRPEEHIQLVNPHALVPFYKTILPAISHPVVIEFLELPLRTARKETFVIRNETPLSTKFSVSVKNFDPVRQIPTELKSTEERILETYSNVMTRESGMNWYRMKQAGSGVVLVISPLHGELGPYEAVSINVLAYADTWGIYTDEVSVDIIGLPIYTFGVCVQVTESPISYSAYKNLNKEYPLIRFGAMKCGSRPLTRKIQVENNSVLPLMINWHCFLYDPDFHSTDKPFNIVLDLYTPFVDRDITMQDSQFRGGHSISKILRSYPEIYKSNESSLNLESADSNSSSRSLISDFTKYPANTATDTNSEHTTDNMSEKNEEIDQMKNYIGKFEYLLDESQDVTHKDTNIQLSLIPYYGQVDYHVFSVSPQEMFIPAKSKRWLTVTMTPDKQETFNSDSKIYGKALGFIRIAPMHKYKADCFSRSDGYYYPPTEIKFEGNLIMPRLHWDIPRSERVFIFYAASIMQHSKQQMQIKRRYLFTNQIGDLINVNFATTEPFSVARLFTQDGCTTCRDTDYVVLNHDESVEVEITCTLAALNIKRIMEYCNSSENIQLSVVVNRTLQIIPTESCMQEVQLYLKIFIPLLKLSSHKLKFGKVHIGGTRSLGFRIENHSIDKQFYVITRKFENDDFSYHPAQGYLEGKPTYGNSSIEITIDFIPRESGLSKEVLEIRTMIPGYMKECHLQGEGSLDERFFVSGI